MADDILKKARVAVAAILTVLVIVIAFQNTGMVTIQLLFWNLALSRILVLLVTFVLGALAGILGGYLLRARRRQKAARVEAYRSEEK